jgi:hypothetical protein
MKNNFKILDGNAHHLKVMGAAMFHESSTDSASKCAFVFVSVSYRYAGIDIAPCWRMLAELNDQEPSDLRV